jgi:hypothetical protein
LEIPKKCIRIEKGEKKGNNGISYVHLYFYYYCSAVVYRTQEREREREREKSGPVNSRRL